MPLENPGVERCPEIISTSWRDRWREIKPSIWALNSGGTEPDPAQSILRTLLDQPRWIRSHFLYDEKGSYLFEEICELPEYYLTRTEEVILSREGSEILEVADVDCIVELGAGFSKKTVHVLREQSRHRGAGTFAPVDLSLAAQLGSRDAVEKQFPDLLFQGLCAHYEEGISSIDKEIPTLFVFLGNSVGNFSRSRFQRFFSLLSDCMGPQDYFLLGVDRVKETHILEQAYNDSKGITAQFILNVFEHLNLRVGSNFNLEKINYFSYYNAVMQRMEMYGSSACDQVIQLPAGNCSFVWKKDEKVLVEISRKFEPRQLSQQLQYFGLDPVKHFTDSDRWFSLLLFKKASLPA